MATVLLAFLAGAVQPKPAITLRAFPVISFAPSVVRFTGRVSGVGIESGFVCPSVAWAWGDGCRSENEPYCKDPYSMDQPTEIRYSADHIYRLPGTYDVVLRVDGWNDRRLVAHRTIEVRGAMEEEE